MLTVNIALCLLVRGGATFPASQSGGTHTSIFAGSRAGTFNIVVRIRRQFAACACQSIQHPYRQGCAETDFSVLNTGAAPGTDTVRSQMVVETEPLHNRTVTAGGPLQPGVQRLD